MRPILWLFLYFNFRFIAFLFLSYSYAARVTVRCKTCRRLYREDLLTSIMNESSQEVTSGRFENISRPLTYTYNPWHLNPQMYHAPVTWRFSDSYLASQIWSCTFYIWDILWHAPFIWLIDLLNSQTHIEALDSIEGSAEICESILCDSIGGHIRTIHTHILCHQSIPTNSQM